MPIMARQRLVWKGLPRQLLRKLKNALESLNDLDQRTETRAHGGNLGGNIYFGTALNQPVQDAMETLAVRIGVLLTLRG